MYLAFYILIRFNLIRNFIWSFENSFWYHFVRYKYALILIKFKDSIKRTGIDTVLYFSFQDNQLKVDINNPSNHY